MALRTLYRSNRPSIDILAVNWAVFSFVIVVLFVIALALPPQFIKWAVSFPTGFALCGIFAIGLHGLIIFILSRSKQLRTAAAYTDGRAVKMLEYTISAVCRVLYSLLWWYHALEATVIFLFVPTYFVTSLAIYHVCFNCFARGKIDQKTLWVLAGNIWTLGHYTLIFLKVLKP
jgi:hypothetical protein